MPNLTSNFSFNKPLVNDPIDEDLWGGQLNDNWDSIDGILPVPAASKYGAIAVQSTDDASFEILSGQGTSGQVLTSNGPDALPSFQEVGSILYPVGSLYMNKSDATNPATLLGFGTWVAITDKFIVARGSTYTGTGGSASVTLSVSNLPPHTHLQSNISNGSGGSLNGASVSGSTAANTQATSSTGSGSSFSIIPPYQAVYIWERTV